MEFDKFDLCGKIVAVRKKHGWTQREMAEKVGISPGGYANYEKGKRDISAATLRKIAIITGATADELLGMTLDSDLIVDEKAPFITVPVVDDCCAPVILKGDSVQCLTREAKEGELAGGLVDKIPVFGRLIGGALIPLNPAHPVVNEFKPLGPAYKIIRKVL